MRAAGLSRMKFLGVPGVNAALATRAGELHSPLCAPLQAKYIKPATMTVVVRS